MRCEVAILIRVGYVSVIAILASMTYSMLQPAKGYSGPDLRTAFRDNLQTIEMGKEMLKEQRRLTNGYMPAESEIAAAYSGETSTSLEDILCRRKWGDTYIINRIGFPAYVYLTNPVAGLPAGCKLSAEFIERDTEKHRRLQDTPGVPDANPTSRTTNSPQ